MIKETCLECNKPAQWVRSTQFAGEHPYCEEHAIQEKDFHDADSYMYWYEIDQLVDQNSDQVISKEKT
jgi:hypothetical protein